MKGGGNVNSVTVMPIWNEALLSENRHAPNALQAELPNETLSVFTISMNKRGIENPGFMAGVVSLKIHVTNFLYGQH